MIKEEFLEGVTNWNNHKMLLWPALEATKHLGLPVMELGCGDGSTLSLKKYCEDAGIEFLSYDFKKEWADKFGSIHDPDWSRVNWDMQYSVVLVDESPGEHRKVSIEKLKNAKILIVHDSEPAGWNASDYQVRRLFHKFKYVKDFESPKPGAWASALSNTIDVTKFEI
jgi:hypothetical protein